MRIVFWSFVALFLPLAGCGHESAAPTDPSGEVHAYRGDIAVTPYAAAKLDGLWPNEDQHSWSFNYQYEQDFSSEPQIYETAAQVPAAPTPEEVLPLLRQPVTLGDAQTGLYGLRFDGLTTTQSGVTGQNLVESLVEPGTELSGAVIPTIQQRLLNRVGWVRPDLRGKIAALGVSTRRLDTFPILLHGGVWQKTLDYIGTFGDLDRNLAWKFLDADTRQGATFRLQLLPSITTDVFLSAWVVPNRLRTQGSRGGKSIEVVYVVDYGVSQGVDQSGNPIGYFRDIGYGSVTYVQGQGPVAMLERAIAPVEHPEHPVTQITLTQGGAVAIAIP
jgi:hypothetical protein